MEEIVNRVAGSSLISLDLDEFIDQSPRDSFDLKDGLFREMILREKDFREYIRDYDWEKFEGKNVSVHCSVDAIIPSWAFMLVVTKLTPVARLVAFGDGEALERALIDEAISRIMERDLRDAKVVIKGCGAIRSRDYAYFRLTSKLLPVVSSIMYGEPCSTVPVFKRKKQS